MEEKGREGGRDPHSHWPLLLQLLSLSHVSSLFSEQQRMKQESRGTRMESMRKSRKNEKKRKERQKKLFTRAEMGLFFNNLSSQF